MIINTSQVEMVLSNKAITAYTLEIEQKGRRKLQEEKKKRRGYATKKATSKR